MKTIESTLSQLTDLSIVEDLRKNLREKDREFLSVEAKFQEAMRAAVLEVLRSEEGQALIAKAVKRELGKV